MSAAGSRGLGWYRIRRTRGRVFTFDNCMEFGVICQTNVWPIGFVRDADSGPRSCLDDEPLSGSPSSGLITWSLELGCASAAILLVA